MGLLSEPRAVLADVSYSAKSQLPEGIEAVLSAHWFFLSQAQFELTVNRPLIVITDQKRSGRPSAAKNAVLIQAEKLHKSNKQPQQKQPKMADLLQIVSQRSSMLLGDPP